MDANAEYAPQPIMSSQENEVDMAEYELAFRERCADEKGSVEMTAGAAELKRIERATDAARHRKVALDNARAISTARTTLRLTQKQLANALSIDVNLLASIEAGTAIHNGPLLEKIRLKLGIVRCGPRR